MKWLISCQLMWTSHMKLEPVHITSEILLLPLPAASFSFAFGTWQFVLLVAEELIDLGTDVPSHEFYSISFVIWSSKNKEDHFTENYTLILLLRNTNQDGDNLLQLSGCLTGMKSEPTGVTEVDDEGNRSRDRSPERTWQSHTDTVADALDSQQHLSNQEGEQTWWPQFWDVLVCIWLCFDGRFSRCVKTLPWQQLNNLLILSVPRKECEKRMQPVIRHGLTHFRKQKK